MSDFNLTHEWQPVPDGIVLPNGAHVRVNLKTGRKEAKWLLNRAEQEQTDGNGPAPAGLTEDELAAEFTRRHRHHLRYVALWGAWMRWNGRRWRREQTLEAFDLARAVCRDAAEGIVNAKLRAKVLSAATRAAVENLARADRAHAGSPEQWDRDLFALNEPRKL